MNGLIDDAVVMAWDAICDPYQRRYQILTNEIHLGPMVPSPSSLGLDLAGSAGVQRGVRGRQVS